MGYSDSCSLCSDCERGTGDGGLEEVVGSVGSRLVASSMGEVYTEYGDNRRSIRTLQSSR